MWDVCNRGAWINQLAAARTVDSAAALGSLFGWRARAAGHARESCAGRARWGGMAGYAAAWVWVLEDFGREVEGALEGVVSFLICFSVAGGRLLMELI